MTTHIKAYQIVSITGADGVRPASVPKPSPGPGEVHIRVRAASLNYRDLMIFNGSYGEPNLPFVPLADGAGEIIGLGEGVTRWKIGDRVTSIYFPSWQTGPFFGDVFKNQLGAGSPGVLAEEIVLPENAVVEVPPHLSFEEAATLPCAGVTAWQTLVTRGHVAAGETVLLQGTGGVSLFALQFAKLHGARVIITSSSDEKLARARALGADETINYRTTPDWDTEVLRLTGGSGANHVVEVGGRDTFAKSLRAVAAEGAVNVIGGLGGGFMSEAPLLELITHSSTVRGIIVGSREMYLAMNRAITLAQLRPVIDRTFPFEEAIAAYRHLESGAHFGKVVITV
ncbi:MAG TPA: NAD(P)-dependent alcohol dehydrogenase [Chthoniobacterales bacterium]